MSEHAWREALGGLEYTEAQNRQPDDEADRLRLAAELAMVRRGPPIDAVLAGKRAVLDRWPDADRYAAAAVRALATMGAPNLAKAFAEMSAPVLSADERALLADQIERGDGRSRSRVAHAVHVARAARDAAALERALEAAAEGAAELDERRAALAELASLQRARGDFAGAAETSDRAVHAAPRGDDAIADRVTAALDRWLAGDRARALECLRAARARITEKGPRGAWTEESTGALLDRMETGPAPRLVATPSAARAALATHDDGRGVLALVDAAFGTKSLDDPDRRAPTMAHVARALAAAGVPFVRATSDWGAASGLVGRSDALVFVEEERSIGRGFRLLLAVEPEAKLACAREPGRAGAAVAPLAVVDARLALYGKSVLVAFATAEAKAKAAIADDARLVELDRCEVDEDGDAPPDAFVARVTDALLEADPGYEPAKYKKGLSLLEGARQDPDPFIRWYATARERFPEAEWPVQLYAQYLAGRGNQAEAALAWLEAWQRDPGDVRNAAGHGTALWRLGDTKLADAAFRRAATLAPEDPAHVYWQAQAAIAEGDLGRAFELASIGQVVEAPDNDWPESLLTTIHERRDEPELAFAAMKAACRKEPGDAWATCRAVRHHVRRAELVEALAELDRARARDDASPEARRDLDVLRLEVLAASFGPAATWEAGLAALDAHAPSWELFEEVCKVLPFLEEEARARAVPELARRVARTKDGDFAWLALKYLERSAPDRARELCGILREGRMDAVTVGWNEARALLRSSAEADRAVALERLLEVIKDASRFEPLVVYTAAALAGTPDKSLEHLRIDSQQYPGAVWLLQTRGLEAVGEAKVAAGIRERWLELSADDCLSSAAWLVTGRFVDLARTLVDRAREVAPDHPQIPFVELRLLMTAGDLGGLRGVCERLRARGLPEEASFSQLLMALEGALRASDGDLVVATTDAFARVLADSRTSGDPWIVRAARAAALAARGDDAERRAVLEAAGGHPYALRVLAKGEALFGAPAQDEDRERLFSVAPGARTTFARHEVLPWTTI